MIFDRIQNIHTHSYTHRCPYALTFDTFRRRHMHHSSSCFSSATLSRMKRLPLSPRLTRSSSSRNVVSKLPLAVSGALNFINPRNTLNCRKRTATTERETGVSSASTAPKNGHDSSLRAVSFSLSRNWKLLLVLRKKGYSRNEAYAQSTQRRYGCRSAQCECRDFVCRLSKAISVGDERHSPPSLSKATPMDARRVIH